MDESLPTPIRNIEELFRSNGGRDELNLAEFPTTLLSDRVPKGCKTLVFEDKVFDRQHGEVVTRKLTVSGSDAYGLPTAVDDEVLVALLQLTKLDGFLEPKVRLSRYELLRILGWKDVGKNYQRIEEALNRWMGVTLYYEKAGGTTRPRLGSTPSSTSSTTYRSSARWNGSASAAAGRS